MTKTYTGGCACGAIRYETSSEPIFENHCQCTRLPETKRYRARVLSDLPAASRRKNYRQSVTVERGRGQRE